MKKPLLKLIGFSLSGLAVLFAAKAIHPGICAGLLTGCQNPACSKPLLNAANPRPRIWFSPNVQSADYLALMESNWNSPAFVDVFKFHGGNLARNTPYAPNDMDHFIARNGFARLQAFGMRLAIEFGVLKRSPGGTNESKWRGGDFYKVAADETIKMIQRNGGRVSYLTMDEPLSETVRGCHLSYDEALNGTVNFMSYLSKNDPSVQLIDIECYPGLSTSRLKQWVTDLLQRGMPLTGLHLDINREGIGRGIGVDIANPAEQAKLIDLANFLHAKHVRFGVIYWGQRTLTNETYVLDVLNFYLDTKSLRTVTDDIIFQSWHPSPSGKLDIPINMANTGPGRLPRANHLDLVKSALKSDADAVARPVR